jgi:hypothetical protein
MGVAFLFILFVLIFPGILTSKHLTEEETAVFLDD